MQFQRLHTARPDINFCKEMGKTQTKKETDQKKTRQPPPSPNLTECCIFEAMLNCAKRGNRGKKRKSKHNKWLNKKEIIISCDSPRSSSSWSGDLVWAKPICLCTVTNHPLGVKVPLLNTTEIIRQRLTGDFLQEKKCNPGAQ